MDQPWSVLANNQNNSSSLHIARVQWRIRGLVQGIGFRPFIAQLARQLQLVGWVRNDTEGVLIELQGTRQSLEQFSARFETQRPPLAMIYSCERSYVTIASDIEFVIRDSQSSAAYDVPIPADIATCEQCLQEFTDSNNRRFGYPFINCTQCGPRFTIIKDLPYDRYNTSMHEFPMCDACQAEFGDPNSRRYHAQANCCAQCGPALWFVQLDANPIEPSRRPQNVDTSLAFDQCVRFLHNGKIVAVKGIGGFHLLCDAYNPIAVQTLRARKGRVEKPLAIMVADIPQAQQLVDLTVQCKWLLSSKERPIVLAKKSTGCPQDVGHAVSPDNEFLGMMLPYTAIHQEMLARFSRPLVVTSGNISEEPIARDNGDALQRLAHVADAFLMHDRDIVTTCDDSVIRPTDRSLIPIRRSRGYAPMPIAIAGTTPSILAVGADLKSTLCLAHKGHAHISQHLGDLSDVRTLQQLETTYRSMSRAIGFKPQVIVCDLHPDYISSQWARDIAQRESLTLVHVQHHRAHFASILAEHRHNFSKPVLGIICDGTGHGSDGAIWGGEAFLWQDRELNRISHLDYFTLPSSETTMRSPWQCALALLHYANIPWDDTMPSVRFAKQNERQLLQQRLDRKFSTMPSSSCGRLFDGIAALLNVRQHITYEAQAAMGLEALANRELSRRGNTVQKIPLEFSLSDSLTRGADGAAINSSVPKELLSSSDKSRTCVWRFQRLIGTMVEAMESGTDRSVLALDFHLAVVDLFASLAERAREEYSVDTIAFSGGVFQNRLLLELSERSLRQRGFEILTHRLLPPNDGGLSLGQAYMIRNNMVPS